MDAPLLAPSPTHPLPPPPDLSQVLQRWEGLGQAKIALKVPDDVELEAIMQQARSEGLLAWFSCVPTLFSSCGRPDIDALFDVTVEAEF